MMNESVGQWQKVICPECGHRMQAEIKNKEDVYLPSSCPKCGREFEWREEENDSSTT